ncbi:MAG: glycoside hydrolase [Clostridia bacterium]|nr:glycoside hydrolase [Clostridia bacterium]
MYKFKQNAEISIVDSPLVKENSFLNAPVEDCSLPLFTNVKDKLPSPIWEGHQKHIDTYYKAWEIAFGNLKKPAKDSGFVSNYIDAAFNNHIFMWDSCFMLMFGKYADRIFNFQKTLDNFYSHQHKDGFICRVISEEFGTDRFTRYDPSATGPEIMPWCEWEYYLNFGDKDRLEKVFPPLMAYHRWMKEHFTWQDGSYFSTGWGCGMDNIPRQSPEYDPRFSHGHMIWVDTCMQELLSCKVLIDMANTLGRKEFIDELTDERDLLENIINQKLWDEKTGFYYDLWKNGKHNMVRHIGGLWAFISGCADKEKADRLISYLNDENEFKTDVRVPTLSKSHSSYSPLGGYWCGSVWAPTNYMILKGLDKYGEFDLAHEIGVNYLDAVVDVCNDSGTLYENYAPEFANGKADRGNFSKPNFVGWTGIAPISVLFEYVFGIKPYAEQNKIVWQVNLLEKHGVEKYPFGKDGELTLVCEKRQSNDQTPKITFESNIPVELEIVWGNKDNKQSMIING